MVPGCLLFTSGFLPTSLRRKLLFAAALLSFTASFASGSSPATPVVAPVAAALWQIKPSPLCLFVRCAVFEPADGSPVQPQAAFSPLVLDRPGVLWLPARETELDRPATHQHLSLLGPGSLRIGVGGSLSALTPLQLRYRHPGEDPADLELVLPPLIVGTHGTTFAVEVELDGTVRLAVDDGVVLLRWLDAPQSPPAAVAAGRAVEVDGTDLEQRRLKPRPYTAARAELSHAARAARGQPRGLDMEPLPASIQAFELRLEAERTGTRPRVPDATLERWMAQVLTGWPLEALSTAAMALADARPDARVAALTLFRVWQLAWSQGHEAVADALYARMVNDFYGNPWRAALEGQLQWDALRQLRSGSTVPGSSTSAGDPSPAIPAPPQPAPPQPAPPQPGPPAPTPAQVPQ